MVTKVIVHVKRQNNNLKTELASKLLKIVSHSRKDGRTKALNLKKKDKGL